MKEAGVKQKVALMSYAMDNRKAKGIALYTRKLIEGLLSDPKFDYYLVHYEKVDDPIYNKAHEIIMPKVSLPYGARFISQMMFFWKYRKEPFHIVHWFHPRVYPFYWLAPAKKIIVTMHGAGDITAPHKNFVFSRFVFNFVLKYLHQSIDIAVVDSLDAKSEVVKYYNFPERKVKNIYLGGGENYICIPKEEAMKLVYDKYKVEGNYILDISRFVPHKNVVTLVHAYSALREKYSSHKEKLVVVGGSENKNSEEYMVREKSAFKEDIIFIDYVHTEDLNAIYSGADLFVFPSLDEGFGLPVLEAMASGTPVVTSNIASMGEIGGEAATLVNPRDPMVLVEIIHDTLIDEQKLTKMKEAGLLRAKEFTWGKMVEKTEEVYKNLI